MDQPSTLQDGLVVPVKLSALIVNEAVQTHWNFQRWQLNFHRLNLHLNPEPDPFGDLDLGMSSDVSRQGVYLQWEIPDALRRGTHDADKDTTSFPVVPNRWLIVRRCSDIKMWVVESDHLDRITGTSPFLYTDRDGVRRITCIGREVETTDQPWAEPDPPAEAWKPEPGTFLTAHGPGIPAFSQYQPYNENVFSFHDPLDDHRHTDEKFSYLVVGWYSAPGCDPLAAANSAEGLSRILTDFHWEQVRPGQGTAQRSYYAGMTCLVDWHPDKLPGSTSLETRVAVGNSSLDALVAMVESNSSPDSVLASSSALLEALQYGMLDKISQPDGMLDLEQQIQKQWFTHAPGGFLWQITDAAKAADSIPAVNEKQRTALAELNDAQAAYDTAVRELHDLRRQLYDAWWLHSLPVLPRDLDYGVFARKIDPKADGSLAQRVREEIERIGEPVSVNGQARSARADSLAFRVQERVERLIGLGLTLVTNDPPAPGGLLLRRAPAAPFHTPQDPVVLICGAGMHEPMDTATTVPCRPVEAIAPPRPGDEHKATIDGLLANVPAPVRALAHESAWYTTGNTDKAELPDGAIPPPAFVLCPWTQPWQPLYLEWQVRYYPIPHTASNGKPNWAFNGKRYEWKSQEGDEKPQIHITLNGRSMLSAHTAFNMAARIRQHAKHHPDSNVRDRLEKFADSTREWDLLAQSLGGFTAQLACHDQSRNVQPDGELRDLVGPGWRSAPDPGPLPQPFKNYPSSPFQQIRAGQFEFTELKIVDRFGRAHVIIEQNQEKQWAPERTSDTTPSKDEVTGLDKRGVHLRPRLVQGARLCFDLVDTTNDGIRVDHDPRANPVCGWLQPNHIDQALACYTPDGRALGELRPVTNTAGTTDVTWYPLPGSPAGTFESLSEQMPHLHRFLNPIRTGGTAALAAVLRSIDNTLNSIHPGTAHADTTPAVLAGRPLALVRSRLSLELDSRPITDPTWQHVLDRPAPEFPNYEWPVQLGEYDRLGDGLLAYQHDTHGPIFTVHPTEDDSAFLKAITPSNYPRLKAHHHPHTRNLADPEALYLTLLLDPSAQAHATTGIVPTASLSLPARFTQHPLNTLEVFFRAGPLLTVTRTTDNGHGQAPDTVLAAPRPSLRVGTWNWTEHSPDGTAVTLPLVPADTQPRASDTPPAVRNGLLKLTPASPGEPGNTP
ncbi:hypothetical protein [Streptomyces olivoreticuli]|uniref:hypothetical protein n=1 Tax=Streptomyces olivoreticuli TaxID=68246 RepID=UPI000E26BB1F|nr:hypothetical protein [Streptomyces olivoreticuli]